jgi:polyisoprenyl-teichoic acid--peptidoglycan teichoic acid transferase
MKRQDRLKARKRKKRQTIVRMGLVILLLAGLVAGIMNFHAVKTWAAKRYVSMRIQDTTITEEEQPDLYGQLTKWIPGETLNVLFIGIDKGSVPGEEGFTRSDVMILVSVNVKEKKAVLISVPRDTKVTIAGHGTQKINAAHAFSGPAGAVEAVKKLSGLDISDYAEVDFNAFKGIVDAIGGVPFHLDKTINDPMTGYLSKGDYILNGEQALIICRSRETLPNGDLDRIENQKKFLKAVMEKAVTFRDIQGLLKILDSAVQYLQTTMQPDMIFTLAEALQGMQVQDVQFATIPGDAPTPPAGQPWYFVADPTATAKLFDNVKKYCSTMTPEEEAAAKAKQDQEQQALNAEVDRSKVRLAVLNGSRTQGVAARVAQSLQQLGYTNVKTDSAKNVYTDTTVYYYPGHEAEARTAAKDIDPNNEYTLSEDSDVTSTNNCSVVVVIGKDYVGG